MGAQRSCWLLLASRSTRSTPANCVARAFPACRHWELPEEVDPRKSLFVTGDVNVGRDPSNVNVWGNMTLTGIVDLTAGADPDETILVSPHCISGPLSLWSPPLFSQHSRGPETNADSTRIAAPGRQSAPGRRGLREWHLGQRQQSQRDASQWAAEAGRSCGQHDGHIAALGRICTDG